MGVKELATYFFFTFSVLLWSIKGIGLLFLVFVKSPYNFFEKGNWNDSPKNANDPNLGVHGNITLQHSVRIKVH